MHLARVDQLGATETYFLKFAPTHEPDTRLDLGWASRRATHAIDSGHTP